jgi:hypothetical protein
MQLDEATSAIVRVGAGRGFLVDGGRGRLVITAAHCLPELPPPMSISHLEERTYAQLLGGLHALPTVTAECLFVDPVADIAVLGEPDGQILPEAWEAYERLVGECGALTVSDSVSDSVLLLYLDGQWRPCALTASRQAFTIDAVPPIQAGMSGSPIMNVTGHAVGVVVTNQGLHPQLVNHLPAWLARELFA